MTTTKNRGVLSLRAANTFLTSFQQIFAFFRHLMTNLCISLFFLIPASKLQTLLITNKGSVQHFVSKAFGYTKPSRHHIFQYLENPNRISRKNIFYGALATQNISSCLSIVTNKWNLFKRRPASLARSREGVLSLHALSSPLQVSLRTEWRGVRGEVRPAVKSSSAPPFLCFSDLGF